MGTHQGSGIRFAAAVFAVVALCSCGDDDDDEDIVATGGTGGAGGTQADGGAGDGSVGGEGGTAGGAGEAGQGGSAGGELDLALCDPASNTFSLTIDNPYFPLAVGTVWTYQGEEDGATIDLRITVLDQTEEVAGVTTRVVEEHEEEDGEVVEISRNFFAQTTDGTVCYFGEDVDIYEGGAVVSHEGAWRAVENGNQPGIMMPANPAVGMSYLQESAPGVALDHAEIVAMGESTTVPAGMYDETLSTEETTELDPSELSHKTYARDVGMIVDDPVELISVTN